MPMLLRHTQNLLILGLFCTIYPLSVDCIMFQSVSPILKVQHGYTSNVESHPSKQSHHQMLHLLTVDTC